MKYAPLSDMFRNASIQTENQLMAFSGSSWKYFPDTGRSTGAYIIFYQGGQLIMTHICQEQSEYNPSHTAVMALSHFRMLIRELLNKDLDIGPEEDNLTILNSKSTFLCLTMVRIPSTQVTLLEE